MKAKNVLLVGVGIFVTAFAASFAAMSLFPMSPFANKESSPIVMNSAPTTPIEVQDAAKSLPDFRAAAKHILPSIVSITTLMEGENWFGEKYIEPSGSGSGVILSKEGHIVTNYHVVTSGGRRIADQIIVKFSNGDTVPGKLIGADPRADLAVLKVDYQNLQPIGVGDSEAIEVGEWVIAAGNPLGFEQTVSVGIISSKGRPLKSQDYAIFVDGLQTDAAINKGNSGGALCDSQGRLVGINTMIASTDQGSVGIGFAIPINRVKDVVAELIKYGHARYGRIGISVRNDSSILGIDGIRKKLMEEVGATTEPPSKGVIVTEVYDGPATKAGLRTLDIMTEINGKKMNATEDYQVLMADKKPGDKLNVKVWSRGETKSLTITLDDGQG
ncbi:MAG: trypsin-like peptidase domain-containing protein [Fimbriimonadaceae bacterium]|nr:trypsin-like peptidase domain-containing protein [Fimbriimonadaceae bacterium]